MSKSSKPSIIKDNHPLKSFTTLQLGGPAKYFAQPSTLQELLDCLRYAKEKKLPTWILGGGSNIVVADQGLDGLVLQWDAHQKTILQTTDTFVEIKVDGGHDWDELVQWSIAQDLAGLECLSGIPGRVGAAPIQNIGAYGQEICEVFHSVEVLALDTLQISTWEREHCEFAYRQSAFKKMGPGKVLLLHVTLRLRTDTTPTLRYPELQRTLQQRYNSNSYTLQEVRDTVLTLRRKKSMVFDPQDPNSHSAGSFFMNPIVPEEQAEQVFQRVKHTLKDDEKMPRYPAGEGQIKLSAAWLIDRSGLHKGYGDGQIGLSQHHTLALVNRGEGTAQELVEFAQFVQQHVHAFSGIQLHPEPVLLGFDKHPLQ